MSSLDRLLGKATAQAPVAWPAMVLVPTGLDPMSGGRNKFMRGFYIRDADTDRGISYEELSELVPGAFVFNVAGTSHREDALQGAALHQASRLSSSLSRKTGMTAMPLPCGTRIFGSTSAMFPENLRPRSAAYPEDVNHSAPLCSLSFYRASDGWR
jgi:hypothetical protein